MISDVYGIRAPESWHRTSNFPQLQPPHTYSEMTPQSRFIASKLNLEKMMQEATAVRGVIEGADLDEAIVSVTYFTMEETFTFT